MIPHLSLLPTSLFLLGELFWGPHRLGLLRFIFWPPSHATVGSQCFSFGTLRRLSRGYLLNFFGSSWLFEQEEFRNDFHSMFILRQEGTHKDTGAHGTQTQPHGCGGRRTVPHPDADDAVKHYTHSHILPLYGAADLHIDAFCPTLDRSTQQATQRALTLTRIPQPLCNPNCTHTHKHTHQHTLPRPVKACGRVGEHPYSSNDAIQQNHHVPAEHVVQSKSSLNKFYAIST